MIWFAGADSIAKSDDRRPFFANATKGGQGTEGRRREAEDGIRGRMTDDGR